MHCFSFGVSFESLRQLENFPIFCDCKNFPIKYQEKVEELLWGEISSVCSKETASTETQNEVARLALRFFTRMRDLWRSKSKSHVRVLKTIERSSEELNKNPPFLLKENEIVPSVNDALLATLQAEEALPSGAQARPLGARPKEYKSYEQKTVRQRIKDATRIINNNSEEAILDAASRVTRKNVTKNKRLLADTVRALPHDEILQEKVNKAVTKEGIY